MASARPEVGREVSIFGTDVAGKPFSQTARAVGIRGSDVTLEGLTYTLKVNDTVGVRHAGQKVRFCVMWVGAEGTPQHGQVGLRSMEPNKNIWIAPTEAPAPIPADMPALERTPSFAGRERRRHVRIACRGSVKFRREGADAPDSGMLKDLSEGGCYVESVSTAPQFSHLDLSVNAEGLELRAIGEVHSSHPGFGMGIAFAEMNPAYRSRLHEWVFQHSRQ